jgi:hypothetical protein
MPQQRDGCDLVWEQGGAGRVWKILAAMQWSLKRPAQQAREQCGGAAALGLVAGALTVRMVEGIDGKHGHPDFSEILLESPDWGNFSRRLYSDCTVWARIFSPIL